MSFPQSIIDQAWIDAKGKCEQCKKDLSKASRGKETEVGWEAHHKTKTILGSDTLSNCKILCQSCHKKTRSYGG